MAGVAVPPVFRYNTRQNKVPVGSLSFTAFGGTAQSLILPRAGWLSRIFVTLAGTLTTSNVGTSGSWPTYPELPFSLLSNIRVHSNTQTDLFNMSGYAAHVTELTRRKNQTNDKLSYDILNSTNRAAFFGAPAGSAVTNTASTVVGMWEIPIYSDDALSLGMIYLMSDQITMSIDLTPAALADIVGTISGPTITPAFTCTVEAEYFDQPPVYPNQQAILPNTQYAVLRREENRPIVSTGETFLRLPIGNTYTKVSLMLENGGAQIANANINSVGIRYGQTVSPYFEDYRQHVLDNYNYLGIVIPDGMVNYDFTRGSGVQGVWDGRDFVNSSETADLGVFFNLPSSLSLSSPRVRVITTQLAAIGGPA